MSSTKRQLPVSPINRRPSACCQSYFVHLAKPIFHHICTFLDLDCKCRTFPVLSKLVNSMFVPSLCCRGTIHISFSLSVDETSHPSGTSVDCNALSRCMGRIRYVRFAQAINVDLTALQLIDRGCRVDLINAMIEGLKSPTLRSFTLKELVYFRSVALTRLVDALRTMASEHSNLQSLSVMCLNRQIASDDERLSMQGIPNWNTPERLDWSGLVNCQRLQKFKFGTDNGDDVYFEHLMNVLDAMPNVTDLDLEVQWAPGKFAVIEHKFSDSNYLPNLKAIRFGEPLPIASACSTIMTASQSVRPFEALSVQMSPELDFNMFGGLRKLLFRLNKSEFDGFCALPDDLLVHLRHFDVEIVSSPVNSFERLDLSPLFIFLSQRPIEEIFLMVMSFSSVGMPALKRAAVQAWGRMSLLKKVSLSTHSCMYLDCSLFDEDLTETNYLPAGCWPQLESLTLSSVEFSEHDAPPFLSAAPSLKHLAVEGSQFNWAPMLPVVALCCPNIVTIKTSTKARSDDLEAVQEAFQTWECPDDSFFKHLTTLYVWERISNEVLHFLTSKLSAAPVLTDFRCDPTCECKFRLMLKKPLRHLKALTSTERRLTRDLMYIDDPDTHERTFMFENDVRGHAVTEHSSKFRREVDEHGFSGRDLFFLRLEASLSKEDVRGLIQWDAGDYSWHRPVTREWGSDVDDDFDEWDEEDEEFDEDQDVDDDDDDMM